MTVNTQDIGDEIRRLGRLSRLDLKALFTEYYRTAPPAQMSRELLTHAIAFKLQCKARGGPGTTLRRRLTTLVEELRRTGDIAVKSAPPIKAGTRLVRSWQGETHEVTVAADGYVWRGQSYRSLSEVARSITGSRWSGPRFFGLRPTHRV